MRNRNRCVHGLMVKTLAIDVIVVGSIPQGRNFILANFWRKIRVLFKNSIFAQKFCFGQKFDLWQKFDFVQKIRFLSKIEHA
jgi:hypothetical protein